MSFSWLRRTGRARIDPDGIGQRCRPWRFADEPFGVLLEGCGAEALPLVQNLGGEPRVNHVRRQHRDATVVVFVVVPVEEALAMGAAGFQRAESIRELRPVLQRFELAFRKRVVVGHTGPTMRLGHAEIGEFQG